jgi:neuroblastoma suppressor of tumorigenicity 1
LQQNSNNNDDYQVDNSIEETNEVPHQPMTNHDLKNEHNNEIPQFHTTSNHQAHTENIKAMLNNRLITLLKNIQEKNSQYDKKQLIELLKIIQGPDQNLSDKNIVDFVESLNSEHIELDIPRLKEILMKVEHEKHHQHHNHHHNHHQQQQQGHDSHELELLPEEDGHLKSTYIGMGHLKKGPHNALVMEPDDKSQQLIDVNSNDLKPNHAGTLLSYHQHHQSQK